MLTQPGGEPHETTLSVRETALVAEADVLVVAGGVQPAVDDAVGDRGRGRHVVDTSSPDFEHPQRAGRSGPGTTRTSGSTRC